MAPDFLVRSGESDALFGLVRGEDETLRPQVAVLDEPQSGALCAVFHVRGVWRADLDDDAPGDAPALDGSGRPLILVFGFVGRGSAVTDLDERDLDLAWESARAVYRRFHRDELAFAGVSATPFPLRSTITPHAPGSVAARSVAAEPPRTTGRRSRALTSAAFGALVMLLVLSGVTAGVIAARRGQRVVVPALTGRTLSEAQAHLRDADLESKLIRRSDCSDDLVHDQNPANGARVDPHSTVTLTVCAPTASGR
ncbi:hypothetical protein CIK06_28230 [Plantactinospora sp. KBS50]|nr:hypothetical protein CIK06_28230 [Plantactinospora sp. KBS50]